MGVVGYNKLWQRQRFFYVCMNLTEVIKIIYTMRCSTRLAFKNDLALTAELEIISELLRTILIIHFNISNIFV